MRCNCGSWVVGGAVVRREALRPEGHAAARTGDQTGSIVNRALAWPALPERRLTTAPGWNALAKPRFSHPAVPGYALDHGAQR